MSTQQSKAALDVLFADNITRQITPSKLRDFLESCLPSKIGLHFEDPGAVTPIAAQSTFVKAANVSTLHDANRFTMPANNRMLYGGIVPVACMVTAALSFKSELNNQILAFAFAINGVVSVPSIIRTKVAAAGDVQAITVITHPTLNPGDYVELWVANDSSAGDITIDHGHLHLIGFLT